MVANTDYNNISIHNYTREILPAFMLALFVFVTNSLNSQILIIYLSSQTQFY